MKAKKKKKKVYMKGNTTDKEMKQPKHFKIKPVSTLHQQ